MDTTLCTPLGTPSGIHPQVYTLGYTLRYTTMVIHHPGHTSVCTSLTPWVYPILPKVGPPWV